MIGVFRGRLDRIGWDIDVITRLVAAHGNGVAVVRFK